MKYGKRKKATKEANYRKYSKYKKAPGGGEGWIEEIPQV